MLEFDSHRCQMSFYLVTYCAISYSYRFPCPFCSITSLNSKLHSFCVGYWIREWYFAGSDLEFKELELCKMSCWVGHDLSLRISLNLNPSGFSFTSYTVFGTNWHYTNNLLFIFSTMTGWWMFLKSSRDVACCACRKRVSS